MKHPTCLQVPAHRRLSPLRALLLVALSFMPAWPGAMAGSAHEHGLLRLDVAVEGKRITLDLESPLDNLLGFERAPRTDAERQRAEAVVARLKAADTLFTIDGAAQCQPVKAELHSAALALGSPASSAHGEGHAEIDGSYEFECKDAARAGFIDVSLFEAFAGVRRIEVQVIAPKGQFKAMLKRPARRIALVR